MHGVKQLNGQYMYIVLFICLKFYCLRWSLFFFVLFFRRFILNMSPTKCSWIINTSYLYSNVNSSLKNDKRLRSSYDVRQCIPCLKEQHI